MSEAHASKEFLDVLQTHLLDLHAEDLLTVACLSQTCRAWRDALRTAVYHHITVSRTDVINGISIDSASHGRKQARPWTHDDLESLASWLKSHPHVMHLEITTEAQGDAVAFWADSLPQR